MPDQQKPRVTRDGEVYLGREYIGLVYRVANGWNADDGGADLGHGRRPHFSTKRAAVAWCVARTNG